MPIDESKIPEDQRVPRTTSALWKFEGGATCSFTHALTLQGTRYSTELEVYRWFFPFGLPRPRQEIPNCLLSWAVDGWQMKVVDLYNEPTLYVRSPESDAEQKVVFDQVCVSLQTIRQSLMTRSHSNRTTRTSQRLLPGSMRPSTRTT